MGTIYWKIDHEPWNGSGWDTGSKTTITDFYDPIIQLSLGAGRDNFSMKVTNFNGNQNLKFNPRDKLTVYRKLNSNSFTSSDIVMVVLIEMPEESFDTTKQFIKVKGNNYSEIIMNAITFVDAENTTIIQTFQNAFSQVNGTTSAFSVTWYSGNPTTTSTGGSFPIVGKRYYNKPILNIIEEWSTSSATGDGNYYWYVDNNNEFRWFRGTNTTSRNFDVTTEESLRLTPTVDTDVKNVVIAKGGNLPNGNQVQTRYTDWSSYAKYGSKPHILISENNTVSELTKIDFAKSYGTNQQPDKYPDLSSSFTTAWEAKMPTQTITGDFSGSVSVTSGSTVTINQGSEADNKKAYNAVLFNEIRYRITEESKKYLENRQNGKFQLSREVKAGTVTWGLGDRIQTTMPSKYSGSKELRVQSIQYTDSVDTFTLEEDIGTI